MLNIDVVFGERVEFPAGLCDSQRSLVSGAVMSVFEALRSPVFDGRNVGVSVLITDDEESRQLNSQFRNKDMPTNVLSWPAALLCPDDLFSKDRYSEISALLQRPADGGSVGGGDCGDSDLCETELFLGDIAISFERLCEEAKSLCIPVPEYFAVLVIHGVLHLLGYDHESDDDYRMMLDMEHSSLLCFQERSVWSDLVSGWQVN